MPNKNIIRFLVMSVGTLVLSFFFPWWAPIIWIVLIAFLMHTTAGSAILLGALSLGIVWLGMSIILLLNDRMHIIEKSAQLLGGLSDVVLILSAFVIALITGALSAWFGNSLAIAFRKTK